MSATIKDVARAAGCSIKTVSRVINNEPYVTPALRARVQSAIRTVGYAPNISARRLATNKAYMACILIYPGSALTSEAILHRVLDLAYDDNYDFLLQPYFPGNPQSRNKLVSMINERRIDGFVSMPPCDADDFVAGMLQTYKVPLVQVNPVEPSDTVPWVAGDDEGGARAMTAHLLEQGHRRIAFLRGPRNLRASQDRLRGYQSALAGQGLPEQVEGSEFTFDGGYTAARLLMERPDPPTAVFAGHDEAAYGALFALQELGKRVPQDISVCGFEDLALSKSIWPGLTTVHQPADEMLERAARMLLQILKGEPLESRQVRNPARLVIRGSTGPLLQ